MIFNNVYLIRYLKQGVNPIKNMRTMSNICI